MLLVQLNVMFVASSGAGHAYCPASGVEHVCFPTFGDVLPSSVLIARLKAVCLQPPEWSMLPLQLEVVCCQPHCLFYDCFADASGDQSPHGFALHVAGLLLE